MWVIALTFIVFQFILSTVAPWFSGWNAGFTYEESGFGDGIPRWIGSHGNFDGYHYTQIADVGYGLHQEAFFPLYPLLIRLVVSLTGVNPLLAGLLISLCACVGLVYLWNSIFLKLAPERHLLCRGQKVSLSLLVLLVSPGAFFFATVYTESVFMLLIGLYVYLYMRQAYLGAAGIGLLLGMTRLSGIFICIVPLVDSVHQYLSQKGISVQKLMPFVTPLIGLGLYMSFLWVTTGNPLEFISAQRGFGNSRSSTIILLPQVYYRYFRIFTTADWNVAYFVAVVEISICSIALVILLFYIWKKTVRYVQSPLSVYKMSESEWLEISLVLFSTMSLILPTLTGTLSSIPRYVLPSISIPLLVGKYFTRKTMIVYVGTSLLLQVALALLFFQGYFVS